MDPVSLLGTAQNAYATAAQKQAAAKAAAVQGVAGVAPGARTPDLKKVKETAQQFEAFFIGQMMEHMMAGIETDPMFGGGHGEEMWRSLLTQEYGKEIAKSGKLGIADNVMRGMLKAQEERTAALTGAAPVVEPVASAEPSDAVQASVAGALNPALRR